METKDYILSEQHIELHKMIKRNTSRDSFKEFVLAKERDEFEEICPAIQQANVDKLFDVAKHLGIPRIYVGEFELVSHPDDDARNDGWPAVWKLSSILGGEYTKNSNNFRSGCGNSGQTQVSSIIGTVSYFTDGFVGKAYDVETREEIDTHGFIPNMVCTRNRMR